MHAIESILSRPEVERLGWVLLHFVWQGTIGAAFLTIALFALRRASANARYATACVTLIATAACLPVTWLLVPQRSLQDRRATDVVSEVVAPMSARMIQQIPLGNEDRSIEPPEKASGERLATKSAAPLPEAPAPPVAAALTWQKRIAAYLPWLTAAWLAGVLALSLRLAIGWSAVRRLRRAASQPVDESRQAVLSRLCQQLAIRWPVKLIDTALVEVPTMIGWLRPVILWPPSVLAGLSVEQFESLLAHELAHIRRHDYLVNLAQTAIETLLFYHPAVWWISSRIRQERECCCDDLAVATCGNRLSYARALAAIEELRSVPRELALASNGGQLLTRIRRIVGGPNAHPPKAGTWLVGAAVLLLLAATIGLSARAAFQPPDNDQQTDHQIGKPKTQEPVTVNVALAPVGSQPAAPALLTRIISGHAVDAETGKPVQGFIYEEATFDERDPARFHWNGEAMSAGSQRDGGFGIVVKNQPGRPIWARIVAPGYVPQPITDKPIMLGDDTVHDKFEVRMHRGKELSGRVVDSAGKPVAAASVYLLRNQGRRQVVRDAAVTGPNQQFEMLAITHAATDADGRFKLTGWDAESGRITILSGEMNLWVTPIPGDGDEWTIHLPPPATIECQVDDDRGERDTLYDLDLLTAGRKGSEMLRAYQFSLSSKDGRLVAANHAPGKYQLTRRRHVAVGDYEGEFRLADVQLQVNAGDVFKIDLLKTAGWPIVGQVVGLKELGLSGAVISVEPPGEVKRGTMTFDAVNCGEDGQFITARIAPGKYRIHVDAYLPKKPADLRTFGGGLDLPASSRLPDFTADAEVTITKDEQPAKLKLELNKGGESRAYREVIEYHQQPHPNVIDEFTAAPPAVATPMAAPRTSPAEHNADKPSVKPGEQPKPQKAPEGAGFDLVVQKNGFAGELNNGLPEELGDRIKTFAHVKQVAGGLMDVISFPEHHLGAVIVNGLPPDSPVLAGWKIKSGRMPTGNDHRKVIVGATLANRLALKAGDKIKIYDADAEVVGVYESKNTIENWSMATLLSELQDFTNRPHIVTGFLVRTDITPDDSTERHVQMAELRKRIEALGEGIAVVPAQPPEEPAEKPKPTSGPVPESKVNDVHAPFVDDAVKPGVEFLARHPAEREATANDVPAEVTITVDQALAAELRALDAMRAGTSTNFEKVDEIGRSLLDRYRKPEEQGQIYYALLQVHGQSGLVTPNHIISYAQQVLKYPLGSRQELMVYIYWGDTLNVQKTEKPWPEQRSEAATLYLKGLKRVWQYHAPEQPPELPDPPALYDGPEGAERAANSWMMKHYMALKNKADFIKELIYQRSIFIRQIADMYHRRPATQAEIDALRKQASEVLANEVAVSRLMAAVVPDVKEPVVTKVYPVTDLVLPIDTLASDKNAGAKAVGDKASEKSRDERPWSEPVNSLKARLSLERGKGYKGSSSIFTYLELWYFDGRHDSLTIPLNPEKIEFKVTDAAGKEVPIKSLNYGVDTYSPNLEIPNSSQLRFYLRGSIVETAFKDPVTFLSLAFDRGCVFPRGDTGEYLLHAKFTIPKTDDRYWHGTIEVPPVRVPLRQP